MEPIKCSPEKKINGMYEREYVDNECTPDCRHYAECKKELGLGDNWIFPVWKERQATREEIEAGLAEYDYERNMFLINYKDVSKYLQPKT